LFRYLLHGSLTVGQSQAASRGCFEGESAKGVVGEMENALAEGDGIDREKDSVDQGVPAGGVTAFDGAKVALEQAMIL
jgi:hypothetical protein